MAHLTAFLDACVLYPAPLRDLLLQLAHEGLYRAKWSDAVQTEWVRNLLINRPDLDPARLERTCRAMDRAVPDAVVTGYEPLMAGLDLPDRDDRHVLAAAIKGKVDVIVTANTRDFPAGILGAWDLEAWNPDTFLLHQFGLSQGRFLAAVKTTRNRLRSPPKSTADYLDILRKQGLLGTVDELAAYADLI